MDGTETIILLIIIGIVSTIFGKGKQGRNQGKNLQLPKSFGDMRKLVNEQLENYSPQKIKPVIEPEKKEPAPKKYREVIRTVETIVPVPEIPVVFEKAVHKPVVQKEASSEVSVSEEVDPKTLINGIIWSEILGEPRARKPYFPRKG